MTLVYLTAQKYPSKKTEPFYWRSMAGGFSSVPGNDFRFVVRDTDPGLLAPLPAVSIDAPNRFVTLFYFFKLPGVIAREKWDTPDTVFVAQDPYLLALLIFLRRRRGYRYRVCSDWHQLFGDWRDRYIARHSDVLVTTSKRLKQILIAKTGVAEERVQVAYGGVDRVLFAQKRKLPQYELRQRLGLPREGLLVGYIGAFMSVAGEKGLATMIEALTDLPPEYRMVFAGDRAGQGEQYRKLAETRGVLDRCIFLPWLSYEQYVECQLAMDVLVIPYPNTPHYRDYGFPMKVWEYMAAGRPITYSNLEIMREALAGRGEPFRPGDSTDLARAIQAARAHPEAAQANAEDASRYTWEARAQRILEVVRGRVH